MTISDEELCALLDQIDCGPVAPQHPHDPIPPIPPPSPAGPRNPMLNGAARQWRERSAATHKPLIMVEVMEFVRALKRAKSAERRREQARLAMRNKREADAAAEGRTIKTRAKLSAMTEQEKIEHRRRIDRNNKRNKRNPPGFGTF